MAARLGSLTLAAMVAVALVAAESTVTRSARSPPTAPSVTVKVSADSATPSSVMGMLMVWVDAAAEPAGKVTMPEVAPRSEAIAVSVARGADHATVVSLAMAPLSVTVNSAFAPLGNLGRRAGDADGGGVVVRDGQWCRER